MTKWHSIIRDLLNEIINQYNITLTNFTQTVNQFSQIYINNTLPLGIIISKTTLPTQNKAATARNNKENPSRYLETKQGNTISNSKPSKPNIGNNPKKAQYC
ncbi:14259_t:CDS:1 [Dentiscutata erythropus]|uniref:14259_t:CDS:1 n=1 Tax=Dentiscutata erythropus TaxID=1348616 RepID=A0A9N8VYF1_9GLOM|nr:14259_t:CDS:1 [Dentiscutata erythropus]